MSDPVYVEIAALRGWRDIILRTTPRVQGWWGRPPGSRRPCRVPRFGEWNDGIDSAFSLIVDMASHGHQVSLVKVGAEWQADAESARTPQMAIALAWIAWKRR